MRDASDATTQELQAKHAQLLREYETDMGRHEAEVSRRCAEVEESYRARVEELQAAVSAAEESAQTRIDALEEEKEKLMGDQSLGLQQSTAMLQAILNNSPPPSSLCTSPLPFCSRFGTILWPPTRVWSKSDRP